MHFKRLGSLGFWGQLACTTVAAAILSFSVVKGLKNGIVVNLLGIGAAILGRQATVGTLVAKALTTSANPLYRSGSSPILALDVFLVQASANTILSHFLGLVFSLELLRSVTLPLSESIQVPKVT